MGGEGLLAGPFDKAAAAGRRGRFRASDHAESEARITSSGAVARSHGSGTSWPSRMTPIGPDEASEPLASMARKRAFYTTRSKCLAPSLRIGLRVVRTSILMLRRSGA